MDTSKQYIKMCEGAKEIQMSCCRSLPLENLFFIKKLNALSLYDSNRFRHEWYTDRIWLPRQDQLQEMIDGDWVKSFITFMWWYQDENTEIYKSMEQLWLSLVMKEEYGKTWNGEEWINVE